MHRTRTGRLAIAAGLAALASGALGLSSAGATGGPPLAHGTGITVRVEGPKRTLVAATTVTLPSGSLTKDGVAADSCPGASAAGALEAATHGAWKGTWSKSLKGYFITSIDGVSLPAATGQYWAFWVNNAPASAGICGVTAKPGMQILFFVDCYGKKCPPNGGVLGAGAPAIAHAGRPFTVAVTDYADANGKASPAAGATVLGGGASATTDAAGRARVTIAHGGLVTLRVRAPHAVRTEARVCVLAGSAKSCG